MDEFTEGHYWAALYAALAGHTKDNDHQEAATKAALDVLKQALATHAPDAHLSHT